MSGQKQERKDDTRRKIIAGAVALEYAEQNAGFAAELAALLNQYVTRRQDRALFDTCATGPRIRTH